MTAQISPEFDETLLRVTNADAEEVSSGKWVQYPHAEGVELKIARYNNEDYLQELMNGRRAGLQYNEMVKTAASKFILTDWRGVKAEIFDAETGESEVVDVSYSSQRAKTCFDNDPLLLDFVTDYCQGDANFVRKGFNRIKKK